ncbi:MAG TPA: hypothetical protein VMW64_02330 [Dehalococcoidia bacterium]|nr:hypothetical protein [Dehalococcoidia bacterium]
MSKEYLKVTYRDIAKMLCAALPVEGQEYGEKVNQYLEVVKALPRNARIALKTAYVFSRKVPREEREDLFQDLALAVLKAKTEDERLAYTIVRCDWLNWWKRYKIRSHFSLDTVTEDEDGEPRTIGELLVGEVEFERKINGKLDAERIWDKLPASIKPIISSRLLGQPITKSADRMRLNRWIKSEGYNLLMA